MTTLHCHLGIPGSSEVKVSACNAGDLGSIPGLERSPGEGNGNPLQYSCLENLMDRGAWWATVHGVAKSWTRLSDFTFTSSATWTLDNMPLIHWALFFYFLLEYGCFTMFISAVQQSESPICIHISSIWGFPPHLGHHRALSMVLCAVQ